MYACAKFVSTPAVVSLLSSICLNALVLSLAFFISALNPGGPSVELDCSSLARVSALGQQANQLMLQHGMNEQTFYSKAK